MKRYEPPPYAWRLVVDVVDSQGTLIALACTSRVISEFALDRLWRRVDCLYDLARCMPRKLRVEYVNRDTSPPNHVLAMPTHYRGLKSSSIAGDRFALYASCVRELNLGKCGKSSTKLPTGEDVCLSVDGSVLDAWARFSREQNLFPRLHSIRFHDNWIQGRHFSAFLASTGSTLTTLDITLDRDATSVRTHVATYIRQIPTLHPNLEALTLDVSEYWARRRWDADDFRGLVEHEPDPKIGNIVPDIVLGLRHLRHLSTCFALPHSILSCLSTLPALESLKCHVRDCPQGTSQLSLLPRLRKLACCFGTVSDAVSFLGSTFSEYLEDIDFSVARETSTEEQISSFLALVSRHPSRDTLHSISLRHYPFKPDIFRISTPVKGTVFGCLQGMVSLRSLDMSIADVDGEATILALHQWLPALSHVKFFSPPLLSLVTIRLFIERDLVNEPMPFDLRVDGSVVADGELPSALSSKVGNFGVDTGIVGEDPRLLARTLISLFPNLIWLGWAAAVDSQDRDTRTDSLSELNDEIEDLQPKNSENNVRRRLRFRYPSIEFPVEPPHVEPPHVEPPSYEPSRVEPSRLTSPLRRLMRLRRDVWSR